MMMILGRLLRMNMSAIMMRTSDSLCSLALIDYLSFLFNCINWFIPDYPLFVFSSSILLTTDFLYDNIQLWEGFYNKMHRKIFLLLVSKGWESKPHLSLLLCWSKFPELYLSCGCPSVSVYCLSHHTPPWLTTPLCSPLLPAVPRNPRPPNRPVNTAVEADDDREGEKTKENQPSFKQTIIWIIRYTFTLFKKEKSL